MDWLGAQSRGMGAAAPAVEVRRHLARIVASQEFASAARLQQLLSYVVERRLAGATSIKETELAMSVFGRRSTFDPTGDAVVRVAVSNLRRRLRDYYAGTGLTDRVVIEIPKGGYVPVFQSAARGWRLQRWVLAAGIAVGALAVAALLYWAPWRLGAAPAKSVAVLPFRAPGGPADEIMADGFVEDVTTALAHVRGLRVAAHSSAFQFRQDGFDARRAGRMLGVAMILEGSLHTSGQGVRINAQLIRSTDGFHVWSRIWNGETGDLFSIRCELARAIAAALGCQPEGNGTAPKDAETYTLYLKGQHFQNRATLVDLAHSAEVLAAATVRDNGFAPAHAALAASYASLAYHQAAPDAETIGRARAAARQALSLDPSQAEAHAVLAWIDYFYGWDWAASERGLRRALELNPNSASTHDWYAQRLLIEGRFDEALAEARRAVELDPLNYRLSANTGIVLYCAQRYAEAMAQARQALELNPHFYLAHTLKAVSAQQLGRLEEARAGLRAALAENPHEPDTLAHLAVVENRRGQTAEARRLSAELLQPTPAAGYPHYAVAYWKLATGDRAGALAELDRALAERSSDIPVVAVDPVFLPLHGEARFMDILRKIGLKH